MEKKIVIALLIITGILLYLVISSNTDESGKVYFISAEEIKKLNEEEREGIRYISGLEQEERDKCEEVCIKKCVDTGWKFDSSTYPVINPDRVYEGNFCRCNCA